ncbi:MAG: peptide deformylase [Alphaproteobacteria bacterium]|nr:peptide deformylase [Alphaproteobacteria bacterium]
MEETKSLEPRNQDDSLPGYSLIDLENKHKTPILITPAQELSFPLSSTDLRDISILEAKFDQEKNCAGLAAPQIGIGKQIIVFAAPGDPDVKKWRSDFTQTMDKTIWINPVYEGIGQEKNEDYEACFSVPEVAGPVMRYKSIKFQAYTPTGDLVEGTAEGFLARIIQHEVDHVKGILYINYVPDGHLLKIEEYRRKRAAAMEAEQISSS